MKKNKTLTEKIIQSVYVYETKRITIDTVLKLLILILSGGILLVFGGVILDIFIENEMGELFQELSLNNFVQRTELIMKEIPPWIILIYTIGFLLGCTLILSIIKYRNVVGHKIRSILSYWFNL